MTLTETQSANTSQVAEGVLAQRFKLSCFLTAFAVYFVMDFLLGVIHPLEKVSTVNLDRSEYYVGFKSYLAEAKKDPAPKVLLLGSSILMQPLMEKEATFLKQPIKPFAHRRLSSIENLIADSQSSGFPFGVHAYCLAMGGEMISDGYFMLKKSIEAKQIPQLLMIEVAPRDFQCNVVPDITNSDSYKLWATAADLPEITKSSHASFEQMGDFIMARFSNLFRYRADYSKFVMFKVKALVDRICPLALFEKMDGQGNKGLFKKGILSEDTPGSITTLPGVAMGHRDHDEMVEEYTRNYLPVNEKQVEIQLGFLGETLDLCQQYSISPYVFAMPLSKTNREILPASFYAEYQLAVDEVCRHHGVRLVNLQDATWDADSNYMDTVHVSPANVDRLINSIFDHFESR